MLDDLERWLRTTLDTLSRKSDTAAATLYALKLWPALLRYCDDGAIETHKGEFQTYRYKAFGAKGDA